MTHSDEVRARRDSFMRVRTRKKCTRSWLWEFQRNAPTKWLILMRGPSATGLTRHDSFMFVCRKGGRHQFRALQRSAPTKCLILMLFKSDMIHANWLIYVCVQERRETSLESTSAHQHHVSFCCGSRATWLIYVCVHERHKTIIVSSSAQHANDMTYSEVFEVRCHLFMCVCKKSERTYFQRNTLESHTHTHTHTHDSFCATSFIYVCVQEKREDVIVRISAPHARDMTHFEGFLVRHDSW